MASGQERQLRRRIRTVEATKKITRAMELIAASQMVRAQGRIAGSRPYVEGIAEALAITAEAAPTARRLVGVPSDPRRVLVVAIVSDRGLCGAYNTSVLRATERLLLSHEEAGRTTTLVTIGKKAQGYFRFRRRPIEANFQQMTDRPTFEDAKGVSRSLIVPFLAYTVDLVQLVSTRFRSAAVQIVETRQILPVEPPSVEERGVDSSAGASGFYDFEPEPEDLLEVLVPQYVEATLYRALLEASAAEHTARQRAMSAATENADDLITTLRRVMNRARQDTITSEIMEIVGGAEALRTAARADAVVGALGTELENGQQEEQIA